jgi:AcrR family transcriptional regulator
MVQVKKAETRQGILDAAFQLFSSAGYAATTVAQIAAKAGVSASNVYSYFDSKVDVFYELYEPWLKDRMLALEADLRKLRSPQRKVESLLHALWCGVPRENGGFAVNLIQAISTIDPQRGYRPGLLQWLEQRVAGMLSECLPLDRRDYLEQSRMAHILMMAFDGFVISHHLHPEAQFDGELIEQFTRLILASPSTTTPIPQNAL